MNIVVVGDVLLDVDVDGAATRLCPDAPVPVVEVSGTRYRLVGPVWSPQCSRLTGTVWFW